MKKVLFFLISFFVGTGLFVLVLNTIGWQEVEKILLSFTGCQTLAILFLTLLIWLTTFWKWQFILKSQGCDVPKKSLLQIIFASNAVTYLLTPTAIFGGEGFRIYALRKKTSIPWEKNIAAVIIEKLLSISVILIFLIVGLLSFLFYNQGMPRNLAAISTAIIGGLALLLIVFYLQCFRKKSIFKLIFRFFGKKIKDGQLSDNIEKEIFSFFEFRKEKMWKGLGIAFFRYFLIFSRCWLLIFFLTGKLSILIALAIMFFIYLAYSFPTPAGFGSLEAAQAFAFNAFGLGSANGVTFSFILRGAEIIISLIGIVFLIKLGIDIFSGDIKGFFGKFNSKENDRY